MHESPQAKLGLLDIRGFKKVELCSSNSGLNSNVSSTKTSEQLDMMDAQSSIVDARVSINNPKIASLKSKVHDIQDHKACVSRGERYGGFKGVFCQQNIAYVKKIFHM